MTDADRLPIELASRAAFLVWGPPAYSNRSRLLAAGLGMPVHHVYSLRRRGALAALVKYPYQAAATTMWLLRGRPRLLFVQHPPGVAVLWVALYAALTGAAFVVDAHSDAFDSRYWTRPRFLYRWLARRALTTIVTNDHFAGIVEGWGGRATVVHDIPTEFDAGPYPMEGSFNVAVVATFAPDEPLEEVVYAARDLPDVQFRITGDSSRPGAARLEPLPPNVELIGFVPLEDYHGLLRNSDAVMVLTTRDHTMQRGACEALSHQTPIITSDWDLLRTYFHKGAVYVDNSATGIRAGVEAMRRDIEVHRRGIRELRAEVAGTWDAARRALVEQIGAAEGVGR